MATTMSAAEEAAAALGNSVPKARAALRRLKAKGEIAAPYRGFYVIVPPEFGLLGVPCRGSTTLGDEQHVAAKG